MSTVVPSTIILDGGFPAPHPRPGIWCWWIDILLSYTVLSMLPLYSVLFYVHGIVTFIETGSPSDSLGDSLDHCGIIISILDCSPRILALESFPDVV